MYKHHTSRPSTFSLSLLTWFILFHLFSVIGLSVNNPWRRKLPLFVWNPVDNRSSEHEQYVSLCHHSGIFGICNTVQGYSCSNTLCVSSRVCWYCHVLLNSPCLSAYCFVRTENAVLACFSHIYTHQPKRLYVRSQFQCPSAKFLPTSWHIHFLSRLILDVHEKDGV